MSGFLGRVVSGLGLAGTKSLPCSESLIYAIGDIHGRTDLLERLIERVLTDAMREQTHSPEIPVPNVVFVGDLIDRGPDSAGTLEFLMAIRDWPELEPVYLTGNHEEMLLDFLSDPVRNASWLRHGGWETLVSYGLGRVGDLGSAKELQRIGDALTARMGPHVEFLESFTALHRNGNLWFVHAGADPALPMEVQPEAALIWGTPDFLQKKRRDDEWVVHGHVIVDEPTVRHGRIAIDTGAYATGCLTAMKVDGTEISFLGERGQPNRDRDDEGPDNA